MKKWIRIIAALVLFGNIWGYSIYILDEAKNAQCAWEMLSGGQWLEPTFNGSLRTDKPPLHYGFMSLAYLIFGKTALAARLFSGIMGFGLLLLLFRMVRHYMNERTAYIAVFGLLSSIFFGLQFRLATPDPYLVGFLTLGLCLIFHGRQSLNNKYLFGGYAALGAAFLAKGPVAIALAGLGMLIYHLGRKDLNVKTIQSYRWWIGIPIFLIIAAPWFVGAHMVTDGVFTDGFFMHHNLDRYIHTMEGHKGFPGLSIIFLFIATLPFSMLLFPAIKYRKQMPNDFGWFAKSMVYGVIIFFLFSQTMLPNYIAPALPFAIIPLAYFIDRWLANKVQADLRPVFIFLVILGGVFTLAGYLGMNQDKLIRHLSGLSAVLVLMPIAAVVGLYFLVKSKKEWAIGSLVGGYIILQFAISFLIFPMLDKTNPVYKSRKIFRDKDVPVYHYQRMNGAFVFSLDTQIPDINNLIELSTVLTNEDEVIIISRKDREAELSKVQNLKRVFRQEDLFEGHTTVIYRTRRNE